MSRFSTVVICILLTGAHVSAGDKPQEKLRYLRPTAKGFAPECTFVIERDKSGWKIVSETERGEIRLEVRARYDAEDCLLEAGATLTKGEQKTAATVAVADGKARVKRPGQAAQEFRVPPGVIVTSAPDWTDIFLLCRRYDRKKGGKQEFTGLWIHPTQPAALLPFVISQGGSDAIEHDGKTVKLDRYHIRIRGPTAYVAWAAANGTLIRLLPAPGLVRDGFEKPAAGLRSPASSKTGSR